VAGGVGPFGPYRQVQIAGETELTIGVTEDSNGRRMAVIEGYFGSLLMTKSQVLALAHALLETTDELDDAPSDSGTVSDE
jgi:hypothetical protein